MSETATPKITLYISYTSSICLQALEFFKRRNVEFTVYDVSENPIAMEQMARLSGQRQVPVIVIDNQVLVGFDLAYLRRLFPLQEQPKISLGVSVADVKAGEQYPQGAFVGSVRPGSLAERAGIRKGDIIVEMLQQPIKSAADVRRLVGQVMSGDPIPITVWRAGKTLRLTVRG